MKLAIMQPYFFPYIGYWQLISAVDNFVIYDDVNFIKKGYINRNSILINGMPQTVTLELLKASQNKKINEIEVGNNCQKLLKTLQLSYQKAPYYNEVFPMIEKLINQDEKNLSIYTGNSIKMISEYLKINTKFIYSSSIAKDKSLKSQERILNIAKILKSLNYINAMGGQKLYDKNSFMQENIQLHFLKTGIQKYKQFNDNFEPNLSIIDILMFNSLDDIQSMLGKYELV